jgi:hypothetical protein
MQERSAGGWAAILCFKTNTPRTITLGATMCYFASNRGIIPARLRGASAYLEMSDLEMVVVAYLKILSRKLAVEFEERHEKLLRTEEVRSELCPCAQLRIKL